MTETDHHAQPAPSDPGNVAAGPRPRGRLVVLLGVAGIALVADLVSKLLAVGLLSDREPLRVLGGALYLTLARNTGAAFSMGSNMTVVFTAVMIVVIAVIAVVARRVRSVPWAIALGLIMGGASGNLVDRLFRHPAPLRGGVIDFLSVFDPWGRVWPIFNLADMCIVTGGALAIVLAVTGREIDGTRVTRRTAAPDRPDDAPHRPEHHR